MPQLLSSPRIPSAQSLGETIERAKRICFEAQVAIHRALTKVAESKRCQAERGRWRAVWAGREGPDHVVVCCAYCARVRTPDGQWGAIPAGLSQAVHQSPVVRLSHGFCPDCLARHFPS
jgi:hypothetical protein